MCLCWSVVRWTHVLSVPVSLPSSPSQWVLEFVSRISIFKWKGYYKVYWVRRLKAERSAIMVFWSLTSCYHLREKNEITCLAENMFSPSANMSHSSSVTFLTLFPELVSESLMVRWTAEYEAGWFCQITWRGLEEGRLPWSGLAQWLDASCECVLCFLLLFNLCLQVALRNKEWNWMICLLQYSKRCISHRNVPSVCFSPSLKRYAVWWCWRALNRSAAKRLCKWNTRRPAFLPI